MLATQAQNGSVLVLALIVILVAISVAIGLASTVTTSQVSATIFHSAEQARWSALAGAEMQKNDFCNKEEVGYNECRIELEGIDSDIPIILRIDPSQITSYVFGLKRDAEICMDSGVCENHIAAFTLQSKTQ